MLLLVSRPFRLGRLIATVPNALILQQQPTTTRLLTAQAKHCMSAASMDVKDGATAGGGGWVVPKVPVGTITGFGEGLDIGELQVYCSSPLHRYILMKHDVDCEAFGIL